VGRPPGRVHVAISMFSATVRLAKIPLSSGEKPSPRAATAWVGSPAIDSPLNVMAPAAGRR
jgi:hypothetical protein